MLTNNTEFKDDAMRLHITFLEKLDLLTERERACYVRYFEHLSSRCMFITKED
jgi:hypothetical protein